MSASDPAPEPTEGTWAVPAVFFDLDGTLVDPAGGITGGIARTLAAHELQVPPQEVLDHLVGPPLVIGLRDVVGVPEDLIPAVVATYRSWYREEGIAASVVYPGVAHALDRLAANGIALAVTTSKPRATARALLDHHGLTSRFAAVVGSPDDEAGRPVVHSSKEPQVREAAALLGVEPGSVAVVGDRRYDIEAAHSVGAVGIGVSWGFAREGEFDAAGADAVVDSGEGLTRILTPLSPSGPATTSSTSVSKETA